MSDGDKPYVIPMSFGYDGTHLYFHGKGAGKKIDILKKNDKVCFEFEIDVELVESDKPCKWDVRYKSVIGFGKASFLEDLEEKKKALNCILAQYTPHRFELPDMAVQKTTVIKVEIDDITSKTSDPE